MGKKKKKQGTRRSLYKEQDVMIPIDDLEIATSDDFDVFRLLNFNDADASAQNNLAWDHFKVLKGKRAEYTTQILSESLDKWGMLKPLTVMEKRSEPGKYLVIEGRRRLNIINGGYFDTTNGWKELDPDIKEVRCDVLRDDVTKEEIEELVLESIFTMREATRLGKAFLRAGFWEFMESQLEPYRTTDKNFDLTNCKGEIPEDFKRWTEQKKDLDPRVNIVEAYAADKLGVSWMSIYRARKVVEGMGCFIKDWDKRYRVKYHLPDIGPFEHASPKAVSWAFFNYPTQTLINAIIEKSPWYFIEYLKKSKDPRVLDPKREEKKPVKEYVFDRKNTRYEDLLSKIRGASNEIEKDYPEHHIVYRVKLEVYTSEQLIEMNREKNSLFREICERVDESIKKASKIERATHIRIIMVPKKTLEAKESYEDFEKDDRAKMIYWIYDKETTAKWDRIVFQMVSNGKIIDEPKKPTDPTDSKENLIVALIPEKDYRVGERVAVIGRLTGDIQVIGILENKDEEYNTVREDETSRGHGYPKKYFKLISPEDGEKIIEAEKNKTHLQLWIEKREGEGWK